MSPSVSQMLPPILCALAAGALIGLERSAGGRAAGFRTFTLVALGSALLTVPTVHPEFWHYLTGPNQAPMDPTRVIQGIVTGVGFLGAGVIYKDGLNIRGLTTAACIWVVSAIGVLFGLGLFEVGAAVLAAVLAVLTLFRRIESIVPTRVYSRLTLAYPRARCPSEQEVRDRLTAYGFEVRDVAYRMSASTELFEYRATLISASRKPIGCLVDALRKSSQVAEFKISSND